MERPFATCGGMASLGSGSSSPSRTVSGFYYLITGTPLLHGIKLTQRVQQLPNLFAQFAIIRPVPFVSWR
jgi:hypothetical protein